MKIRVSIVAFLSEFGVSKVVGGDENGFGADLFFSIDVAADRYIAEDEADVEALCCTSLVQICGQDNSTVEDPRKSLDRASESLVVENSRSARSRISVDKVDTTGVMTPDKIWVCRDNDRWLQIAIRVNVLDGVDDTVNLQSIHRIVNEDSKPTPHGN